MNFKNNLQVKGLKLIIGYLGVIIIIVGIVCLLPLLVLFFYPEEISNAKYFIIPGVMSILIGYLLMFLLKGKERGKLEKQQDAIIVVLIWVITIFISAMPFWLTGKYNFTQSIFEATSGFSTTGLSVVDVDNAPRIFLMFRSLTLLFGGVGLVLVMTSALSDRYGMRLYNAEGHSDQLVPNLIKSARLILTIYLFYIFLGSVLYMIFGMNGFDAINHSIAALSTGGFSTRSSSIGFYNNIYVEFITMFLMLLGGTNFLIHLYLLKGKLKVIISHCETKMFLILLFTFMPLLVIIVKSNTNISFLQSVRIALFQFVSSITTTGFQNVSTFNTFPSSFIFIIILLMLVGGGLGSTAGGIKQYRIALLMKQIYWSIRNKFSHSNTIRTDRITKIGKSEIINDNMKNDNSAFIMMYLLIFIIGTLIFTSFGYSLEHSMFEFASSLGTVGLSVGITGFDAHPIILWTSTIGMFLGRLEIYIVLLTLMKGYINITKKKII